MESQTSLIKAKKHYFTLVDLKMKDRQNQSLYGMHLQPEMDKIISTKEPCQNSVDVVPKGGEPTMVRSASDDTKAKSVLSFGEIFDIFMEKHITNNHASKEELLKMANTDKYLLPKFSLDYLISSCHYCNGVKKNLDVISKNPPLMEVNVYVIAITRIRSASKFGHLLIFEDKATNFVLLRPMMDKYYKEVGLTLFQIFTQCGPPQKLNLHGYDPLHTEAVGEMLSNLCPMFNVKVVHKRMSFDLPTLVTEKIDKWRSSSDFWELGCCDVQMTLNKSSSRRPADSSALASPFDLFLSNKYKEKEQS